MRDVSDIRAYHAHIYFDPATKPCNFAMLLPRIRGERPG